MHKRCASFWLSLIISLVLFQALCLQTSLAAPRSRPLGDASCRQWSYLTSMSKLGIVISPNQVHPMLAANIENDVEALNAIFEVSTPLVLFQEAGAPNAYAAYKVAPEVLNQIQMPPEVARE